MILYLDSSAAVKLFTHEDFSREMRRIVRRAERRVTSALTWVETRASLARKLRSREITERIFENAAANFNQMWEQFELVQPELDLIRRAGNLAELYPLRADDAVHLATADHLRVATRRDIVFACFDRVLNRAAARIGLQTLSIKL